MSEYLVEILDASSIKMHCYIFRYKKIFTYYNASFSLKLFVIFDTNQFKGAPMKVERSVFTRPDFGCCDFQLKTKNDAIICGRSMEFPMEMDSQIMVYPRNEQHSSTAPDGSKGLEWTSKYGFIGINAFQIESPDEGLNEAGLSFGVLTLRCSKYQTVSEFQKSQALALMDVGTWILGNFATVNEVKEAIRNVRIWGEKIKPLNYVPGLHIALHDPSGNNLVIEFIDGEAVIHENPLGILTNDPPFDFQMRNLEQYNFLTSDLTPNIQINGAKIPTTGIGSGMVGLPGDWSSITRFVRIATVVRFALQTETELKGVELATHILNTVDIPKGVVISRLEDSESYETTRWCAIKDLTNIIFYYRSYADLTLRAIDLKKIRWDIGTKHNKLAVQATQPTILDVTDQLNL